MVVMGAIVEWIKTNIEWIGLYTTRLRINDKKEEKINLIVWS